LYQTGENDEPIIEFLGSDRLGDFRQSTTSRVVEFYNSDCSACQKYKKDYIKLAKETQKKKPEIEFFALSCTEHNEVCNDLSVRSIPAVYLFGAGIDQKPFEVKHSNRNVDYILHKFREISSSSSKASASSRALKENTDKEKEEKDDEMEENEEDEEDNEENEKDETDTKEKEEGETETEDSQGDETETEENEKVEKDQVEDMEKNEEDSKGTEENVENEKDSKDNKEDGEIDTEESQGDKEGSEQNEGDEKDAEENDENKKDAEEKEEDEKESEETDEDEKHSEDKEEEEKDSEEKEEEHNEFYEREDILQEFNKPRKGAKLGKKKGKDMDKWVKTMKEEVRTKREKRSKRMSLFSAKVAGAGAAEVLNSAGATAKMKAHQPGTKEFKDRQEKVNDRLAQIMKKQKLRKKDVASSLSSQKQAEISKTYEQIKTHSSSGKRQSQLPYQKKLKPKSFFRKVAEKTPVLKRINKMTPEEEMLVDVTMSFITSLKTGIYSSNDPLSASQKSALKEWLELLSVALPPEWGLHDLIGALHDNIDLIAKGRSELLRVIATYPVYQTTWSPSCANNVSFESGFSCGYWKLLHLVSIGLAEQHGGLYLQYVDLIGQDARIFSPMDASKTIRNYISHFYPCKTCRDHFVSQYDQCSNGVCDRLADDVDMADDDDWKELAKWLWEVHNGVNILVMKEKKHRQVKRARLGGFIKSVTDQDVLSVLYPTLEECIYCFKEDGSWDEDGVFIYLEKLYWLGSELEGKVDRLLTFDNESVESMGMGSFWISPLLALAIIFMLRYKSMPKNINMRSVKMGLQRGGKDRKE